MFVLISAVTFVAFVIALIDIITRDEWQVRHLPKMVWIIIVILLPLVGSIIWFAVGREYGTQNGGGVSFPTRRATSVPAPQHNNQRALTTEEQLAELDREIEFFEKKARLQKIQRELELGDARPIPERSADTPRESA